MIRFDQALIHRLDVGRPQLILPQTIPGIDLMGAAMLLVEIGADMASFGSAERLASRVAFVRATPRTRANARAERPAKATLGPDACSASSLRQPLAAGAH